MNLFSLLGSIPSPPDNSIDIGPLELRAYGVAIALGVIAAVLIARRRWEARGGDPDDIVAIGMWAVPAGLIGARIYHVITDWQRFQGRWEHVFAIWEGGLGIPGGIAGGVIAGVWVAKRRGLPVPELLDVAAPALPVAQAIGRLGNWFNQELFGRPTDLPWGLEIDPENRPPEHLDAATFHPTFLYEALWNLALAAALVVIGRRWNPRPGQLFAGYVAGYAAGRLWVESLRIDPASLILGVRVNIWVSAVVLAGAIAVIVIRARRPSPEPDKVEDAGEPMAGEPMGDTGAEGEDQPEPVASEHEEAPGTGEQTASGDELSDVSAPDTGSDTT
jgi:prolipoprotein diacylglyceryl transferase